MAVTARLPACMLTPSRRQARRHLEFLKRDVNRQLEEEKLSKLIWEAREFLEDFVRSRWEAYMDSIDIQCNLTLAEVRELGRLPKAEGTRACRRLICVPVINDEIGHALWLELAKEIHQAEGDSVQKHEGIRSAEKRSSRLRTLSLPIATISRSSSDLFAQRARRRYSAPSNSATKSSPAGISRRGGHNMWKATGQPERACVFCRDQGNGCDAMSGDVPLLEQGRAHSFLPRVFGGGGEVLEGGRERQIEFTEAAAFIKLETVRR